MADTMKIALIVSQIIAYILAVIAVVQVTRILIGGSWTADSVAVVLLSANLTITFGGVGYLFKLNNRISGIDKKLHGHIEWHRGKEG